MKNSALPPIYSQVAYDIAMKIVAGEIKIGERFSGRSLMGSQYSVSPETIRRAMRLLCDMRIVSVRPHVGAVVESQERAIEYVERFKARKDYRALKAELQKLFAQRSKIDKQITDTVNQLVDLSDRFRNSDMLRTYEFTIEEGSAMIDQTIGSIQFRQRTGATIVAVQHGEEVVFSPGPEAVLCRGDVLVVACALENLGRVSELMYSFRKSVSAST